MLNIVEIHSLKTDFNTENKAYFAQFCTCFKKIVCEG